MTCVLCCASCHSPLQTGYERNTTKKRTPGQQNLETRTETGTICGDISGSRVALLQGFF